MMEEIIRFKNYCKEHGYNEKDPDVLTAYLHGKKCEVCGKLINESDEHYEHECDHVFYCKNCGDDRLTFWSDMNAYVEENSEVELMLDDQLSDIEIFNKVNGND